MKAPLVWLLTASVLASPSAGAQPFEDAVPPGSSVEERMDEIRRRVQAALEYPPLARRREITGETLMRFEIGTDGRARDLVVVRSAGHPLLDRAAARAVVAAGELPRVWGPLEIPVRFELTK